MIGALATGLGSIALWVSLAMAEAPKTGDAADLQERLRALEAAEAAYQAAWDAVPIGFRKGLFVEGPATAFGSYVPREDDVFAPNEEVHIYVEPVGFAYEARGRLNAVRLTFDLALYDRSGKELFRQERFSNFTYQGRAKVHELYLNMNIELSGIPPAQYEIAVIARDLVSGEETSEFRLPFTIAE